MRILFDNVDLNSRSGPNNFAGKLRNGILKLGHDVLQINQVKNINDFDVSLSFIQSNINKDPCVQRLDGIYFNTDQDWKSLNYPIIQTYKKSSSVIFQSNFNKKLSEYYFGKHENPYVIHNGTNFESINNIPINENIVFNNFDEIWCCASNWRPHKRLNENIRYFLEHSNNKSCLIVAGSGYDYNLEKKHDRVFFVGNLNWHQLISIFKRCKYFIHLAFLDHCPNVVVDARASGCKVICSDSGGTKEIAGEDAILINDLDWDFMPLKLYDPPKLNFSNKFANTFNTTININDVAIKYVDVLNNVLR